MILDLEVPDNLHPDTKRLVQDFAKALAEKLRQAELKYEYSNGWSATGWREDCQKQFMKHVVKGDPIDVAAYCAFMWRHRWPTVNNPFECAAEIKRLRNALRAPLSMAELKLVDKNCDWQAFKHAWNAVMKSRLAQLEQPEAGPDQSNYGI